MCLFKILHIISSIPPSKEETFPNNNNNNKGVGIDLNLRFCSIEQNEESESSVETTSIASAIDQRNINNNNEVEEEVAEGLGEKSENNDHVESGLEDVEEGNEETTSFQGRGGEDSNCLDLLIEAARVLSEKDESDLEKERDVGNELTTRGGKVIKKRKERWVVVDLYSDVVEETEPVVRSKRGRSQALPHRFRDSVVEPLKRSGRPSSTPNARKRSLR